jgi:hypothetical protein
VTPDSGLTTSQRSALAGNNVNTILAFYSADARLMNGINIQGRQIHQVVAGDWLAIRIQENLATLALDYDRRGLIIPVEVGNSDGHDIVRTQVLRPTLQQAVDNGKLRSFTITPEPVTAADVTAQRLRFTIDVVLTTGATSFDITINLATV